MSGAPERIGKYRVLEPLGRGGMGAVYKAHDPVLDRMVAVKVMTEGAEVGTEGRARFLREAQSAARLNHPNIITVYELGDDASHVFIVMELLEGDPLSRVITREPPLPLKKKLGLMLQICDGLAFAHQRGIVHRDIKPANIFVLANWQVKILDFGIARMSSSDLTRTGLLMGTPNYMSPEQARGRRTDHRSDIFSVGVVFYELLSGRKPFQGEDYFETMEKVRAEDPLPLGEVARDLPPALVRAIHRILAKDPAARYQSLDELRADLAGISDVLPAETTVEDLRDAVDRKFAEVARLHRGLASAVGAAALGDETLPLADPAGAGVGLETLLRDLQERTDRLRALALAVERQEPAVARGIGAFERGAFEEAAAALQAVLKEIPQHQRARDYCDRARMELLRERTVRSVGMGRGPSGPAPITPTPGTAATPAPAPEPRVATVVATPPPRPAAGVAPAPPPVTVTEMTRRGSGRQFGVVLAGVALLALAVGGAFLFRGQGPTPAPSVTPALTPPAKEPVATPTPAPAPAPAPAPPVKPPAPSGAAGAAAGAPSRPTTAPAPGPAAPRPAPAPARPRAAEPGPGASAPVAALTPEQAKDVRDAIEFGQVFQARGDHARALREYQRALAIDPRNAEARQGVAEAEAAMKSKP